MLFCYLFIYHLPQSVILSVHEDSFSTITQFYFLDTHSLKQNVVFEPVIIVSGTEF